MLRCPMQQFLRKNIPLFSHSIHDKKCSRYFLYRQNLIYNFERYLALYYITLLFTTEIALSYDIGLHSQIGFVPS